MYHSYRDLMAGEERIELSITVLETAVIPFNYSPKNSTIILLKDTRNVNKNCAVTVITHRIKAF